MNTEPRSVESGDHFETVGDMALMACVVLEDALPAAELWPAWAPILAFCYGSIHEKAKQLRARARELHTMPYEEYLRTEEWQMRRRWALAQVGHGCAHCGLSDVLLAVHHTSYTRRGFERREDLIVLCGECHDRAHARDVKRPLTTSGEILRTFFDRMAPVFEQSLTVSEVLRWWNSDALDRNIQAYAKPDAFRRGTLFVVVNSAAWLDEIVRYRRTEILQALRKTVPAVKKISYRLD